MNHLFINWKSDLCNVYEEEHLLLNNFKYLNTGTGNDWAGHKSAMLSFNGILRRFVSSADVIFGLTLPTGSI